MNNQYTWRQEQQMLCDAFARALLVEHNIKEVTTQRQAKNGTREFEFPVPAYSKQRLEWFKYKKYNLKDLPRLRLACFESGYVRKQNGGDRAYQINKTYDQERRYTFFDNEKGGLYTSSFVTKARQKIYTEFARLNFILDYYLKNYAK